MSSLTLSVISFIRRPASSLLAVISLIIPLAAVGLAVTLIVNFRESIHKYDTSIDAILGPKIPDHELVLSSLFGVGHVDRIIPHGLLQYARKPIKKKSWERSKTSGDDTVNIVKQATPFMEFAEYNGYKVIGTDDTFLERPDNMNCPKVAQGTWFNASGQVVTGSLVAQRENLSLGSTITAESKLLHPDTKKPLWRKKLTVTGILEPTDIIYDRMLYTTQDEPFELYHAAIPLNLLRDTRNNMGMSYVLLWLYNNQEDRLQDYFDNYTVGKIVFVRKQIEAIERLIGGGESLSKFVSGVMAGLGLLCVMVLFNARFEAMGEDIAVLCTLGYGKAYVASSLLWESILVWLSAMPAALVAEWLLSGFIVNISGISMFHIDLIWPTDFHPWIWGLMFMGCQLVTITPLIRLYRYNLHDALKGM